MDFDRLLCDGWNGISEICGCCLMTKLYTISKILHALIGTHFFITFATEMNNLLWVK